MYYDTCSTVPLYLYICLLTQVYIQGKYLNLKLRVTSLINHKSDAYYLLDMKTYRPWKIGSRKAPIYMAGQVIIRQ